MRKTAPAAWNRHRRWAIMRRRLAGPLYAGELFASVLPWGALAIAASSPGWAAAAAALLGLRYAGEIALAAWIGRPLAVRDVALLPVRDLAAAAVFWAGLTGKWVAWRGRPLRIGRETLILDRPKAV